MLNENQNEDALIHTLNQLITLNLHAVTIYHEASAQVEDSFCKRQLQNHCDSHVKHIEVLRSEISDLGGQCVDREPSNIHLSARRYFNDGGHRDDIGYSDEAILQDIMEMKNATTTAYGDALASFQGIEGIAYLLEDHLRDERIHRKWIESKLETVNLESVIAA